MPHELELNWTLPLNELLLQMCQLVMQRSASLNIPWSEAMLLGFGSVLAAVRGTETLVGHRCHPRVGILIILQRLVLDHLLIGQCDDLVLVGLILLMGDNRPSTGWPMAIIIIPVTIVVIVAVVRILFKLNMNKSYREYLQ